MADQQSSIWIAVARLLRPQGRRGELLVEPLTDISGVFNSSRQFWLSNNENSEPAPDTAPVLVEEQWQPTGRNAGRLVLKLAGCNSISEAEQLAGKFLHLRQTDLPALDPDTFMVADLLGCTLFNGSTEVGRVVDIQFAIAPDGHTRLPDAAPLLAVEPPAAPNPDNPAAEPILIPFISAWLESVDTSGKRILMHLPEGLLDLP